MKPKLTKIRNQNFNKFKNNKNERKKYFVNNKGDKVEELLLKIYIQKWEKKNEILTTKENDSVNVL